MLKKSRRDPSSLVVFLVAASLHCVVARGAETEKLINANFNPITDSLGYRWDFNQHGYVQSGTNGCLSSAGRLYVSGNQFSSSRPMMTADGGEFVLSQNMSGVDVTRRIRVDRKRGAARFLDVFRNPTGQARHVSIKYQMRVGSNWQQAVTNTSSPFAGVLGKKDFGVLAISSSSSRPSALFLIASPRSKTKPTVQVTSNRYIYLNYSLPVKAKGVASLVHLIAQRRNVNATHAPKLFSAFHKTSLIKPEIPRDLRRTVLNFRVGHGLGTDYEPGQEFQAVLDLADELGVERSKVDTLVVDEEAHISGQVVCRALKVRTIFGETSVALSEVALLVGGASSGRPTRVYLRNGEILGGTVEAPGMKMNTESGTTLALNPAQINALVMRADKSDGKAPANAAAFLQNHHGDRLALAAGQPLVFDAGTAWGTLPLRLDQLVQISYARDPFPCHRLLLKNKSQISAILGNEELVAKTLRFQDVKLTPQNLSRLTSVVQRKPGQENDEEDEEEVQEPYCELAGDNIIVGQLDLPVLHIAYRIGKTPVKRETIRSLERSDESEGHPVFEVELTGDRKMSGRLAESIVPIRMGDLCLRVPVGHLLAYRVPEGWKPASGEAPKTDKPGAEPAPKQPPKDLEKPAPATPPVGR